MYKLPIHLCRNGQRLTTSSRALNIGDFMLTEGTVLCSWKAPDGCVGGYHICTYESVSFAICLSEEIQGYMPRSAVASGFRDICWRLIWSFIIVSGLSDIDGQVIVTSVPRLHTSSYGVLRENQRDEGWLVTIASWEEAGALLRRLRRQRDK